VTVGWSFAELPLARSMGHMIEMQSWGVQAAEAKTNAMVCSAVSQGKSIPCMSKASPYMTTPASPGSKVSLVA